MPLLGTVAAGLPIEALPETEEIALPEQWLGRGRTFALRVRGNSMIDEQIRDGDVVVVEERETARNGETVIALVDGDGRHGQAVPAAGRGHPAGAGQSRRCRSSNSPRSACACRAW